MRAAESHTVAETRQAILEQLTAVRQDLARHRSQTLRRAGAAWFDLAMGYARDIDPSAIQVSRRDGAQRTLAELDQELRICVAEEIRLREMLEQFDVRIALFAQGALPVVPRPTGRTSRWLLHAARLLHCAFRRHGRAEQGQGGSVAFEAATLGPFEAEHV